MPQLRWGTISYRLSLLRRRSGNRHNVDRHGTHGEDPSNAGDETPGRLVARRKVKTAGSRWSAGVTAHSDALDLEPGVFTQRSAKSIAESLKRPAEHSTPEGRRLPIGAVDAGVLHQPRRQKTAGGAAQDPRARQGRCRSNRVAKSCERAVKGSKRQVAARKAAS
jgi:hypothetical protein